MDCEFPKNSEKTVRYLPYPIHKRTIIGKILPQDSVIREFFDNKPQRGISINAGQRPVVQVQT
jgi:hypothetical protein